MRKLIDPTKVKIILGSALHNSHVLINGKELPCNNVTVTVGSNQVATKVVLETKAMFITDDIKVELDQNSLVELHLDDTDKDEEL